ncbi:hypothetical protein F0U62_04040 [Cystobacter fuscus]|uniref:hypothetical protein n=1 Tax=Cystobacter fuscus TaxID=43 RepID=UPI002B301AFF|nr:hypothetical protein F0U62_04040 [Cystobacter fuscus]
MQLRLKYPPTPEAAPRHAALCVSAALLLNDIDLDYSVDSVMRLDGLLEYLRQGGLTSERMAEVVFAFGCYMGEVFVRRAGGAWCATVGSPMEGVTGFPLVIQLDGHRYCNPIGKVFKRLDQGPVHALPAFYRLYTRRDGPALVPQSAVH